MGSNPSKKANTFSSATLNKNENSDKFLVSKPLKKEKDEEVRIKTEDLSKASNIKNNCNLILKPLFIKMVYS